MHAVEGEHRTLLLRYRICDAPAYKHVAEERGGDENVADPMPLNWVYKVYTRDDRLLRTHASCSAG
jgi:hypothetical protein